MDKFILRLPKGNKGASSSVKKRKQDENQCINSSKAMRVMSGYGGKSMQMYLDLGQKTFNQSIECKKCNLLYISDDPEDQARHQQYCKEVKLQHTFGWP